MRTQIWQQPEFLATYCNKRQSSSIFFARRILTTAMLTNHHTDGRTGKMGAFIKRAGRPTINQPQWVAFNHRTWVKFSSSSLGLTWRVDKIQNYGSSYGHIYIST